MSDIAMISTVLMLVFGIYAVMEHSILRSAIGLALSSAALAVTFYALGAPIASVFELSVCSGLVTVIFISGNLPRKTEIVPLLIVAQLEQFRYQAAAALAAAMLLLSFVLLVAINLFQRRLDWRSR